MTTHIIRIPDIDSAEYDRYVSAPAGKSPEETVGAINERINAIYAKGATGVYEYTGSDLEDIFRALGVEEVQIHTTVQW